MVSKLVFLLVWQNTTVVVSELNCLWPTVRLLLGQVGVGVARLASGMAVQLFV